MTGSPGVDAMTKHNAALNIANQKLRDELRDVKAERDRYRAANQRLWEQLDEFGFCLPEWVKPPPTNAEDGP